MKVTAAEVMREVRSFFARSCMDERWQIENGVIKPNELLMEGEWIAITGSLRNDGIYCLGAEGRIEGTKDECWTGRVWLLNPPAEFLSLCEEIAEWAETHDTEDVKRESFGVYSVEYAVDANGLPLGWKEVFAARLVPWRRMFSEVNLFC